MAIMSRRLTGATFVRPADATQYSIGDEISNNATAGSVVLATFANLAGFRRVQPIRMGVAITPASASLVITALDFSVYLFKTADVPAAGGDNVALALTAVQRQHACKFSFVDTAWAQPTGAATSGASGYQEAFPAIGGIYTSVGNVIEFTGSEANGEARSLTLVLQADQAWNPGAVAQTFTFALDLTCEP